MKKFLFYLLALSFVLSSCEDNDTEIKITQEIVDSFNSIIVNYGSYNSAPGALSGFNSDASKIYNKVFKGVNGFNLKGNPQYAYVYNGKLYFMGNDLDEVYYVENNSLVQTLNGVSADIIKPRYCIGYGDYLYISCYGGNVWSDATLGYVAKYNINTNTVDKIIDIPGGPEGLEIANGNLYVALNYVNKVAVVNLSTEEISYIETPSVNSYFLKDASDNLYVAILSTYTNPEAFQGLGYINTTSNELENTYAISNISTNYSSIMTFNADKSAIFIAASSWVEESPKVWVQKGGVIKFDTASKTVGENAYISSIDGLNALSVNPSTNELYLLISPSSSVNGKLKVYNENGEFVKSYQTGISPSWVLYRN